MAVRKNHIVLGRWGGLGDVCMALAAAKALVWAGNDVSIVTAPEFHELVKACPHISDVYSSWPDGADQSIDLGDCAYGLAEVHQVDAYLEAAGFHDDRSGVKTLDLSIPVEITQRVAEAYPGTWIAIHPSVGDPNRTWPAEHWSALAYRLQGEGFPVLSIGSEPGPDGKGAVHIPGVRSAFGLSPLETVALLHRCKILISCDSGPIQLAGATLCHVVGIYSVVAPERRLPFRLYSRVRDMAVPCYCPHSPCYRGIKDANTWNQHGRPQREAGVHLGQIFANWCLLGDNIPAFACMHGLSVQTVHAAIKGVLA